MSETKHQHEKKQAGRLHVHVSLKHSDAESLSPTADGLIKEYQAHNGVRGERKGNSIATVDVVETMCEIHAKLLHRYSTRIVRTTDKGERFVWYRYQRT